MSLDGITVQGSAPDIRATAAATRPGSVAAAQAAQPRFDLLDSLQVSHRPPQQKTQRNEDRARDPSSASSSDRRPASGDRAEGLGSPLPFSAFIAQSLSQEQDNTPPPSAQLAGHSAYARSAASAEPTPPSAGDLLLPQLSSGKSLDLAV
ncbi:hypothetical protein MCP1_220039 [Candidatus Terasakiella magnetica]|nr:hypothetical protein MCP1_220039 [Candidatus Terasakiella magnetica]